MRNLPKDMKWSWSDEASIGYNRIAMFEETLIKFEIIEDYFDITDTEYLDDHYSLHKKY